MIRGALDDGAWAFGSDPDDCLARVREMHGRVGDIAPDRLAEVYFRASRRIRVVVSPSGGPPLRHSGREEGVAVRLASRAGGPFAFAAASGRSDDALRWVVAQALTAGETVRGDGWATDVPSGTTLVDRDSGLTLPTAERLTAWLEEARGVTTARGGAPDSARAGPVWIEAAVTVEVLVAEGGLSAVRGRRRVWTLARPARSAGAGFEFAPRVLAARSLEELAAAQRGDPVPDSDPLPRGGGPASTSNPVVLDAESSATLVRALVGHAHGQGAEPGSPVGPGWRIVDDPLDPRGLIGGSFDDGGFATRRLLLADGTKVMGVLRGRGHLRRLSFRDPPDVLPSTIVVEPSGGVFEIGARPISGLRIHRLERGAWILEGHAGHCPAGRQGGGADRFVARASPDDLIVGCVGTMGAARPFSNGVVTPFLVLDLTREPQPS